MNTGNAPARAKRRRAALALAAAAAACVAVVGLLFWGQPQSGGGSDGPDAEEAPIADDRAADGGSDGQAQGGGMEGVVLTGPTAADARNLPADEQWPGQSLGFVGPNGEGAYTPADWSTEEEFREIDSKVLEHENEVPKIEEGQGDSKYTKGIVRVYFNRSYGELAAHEVIWSLGGIWEYDDFGYSAPWIDDALASVYFPDCSDLESLKRVAEELKSHEEVKLASVSVGVFLESDSATDMTSDQYPLDQSSFREAWEVSKCNRSAVVAVIDKGFSLDHPDLADNIIWAVDSSTEDCLPLTESYLDSTGHGTMVAGVVSAVAGNGIGLDGASYNALIAVYRASSGGEISIDYVKNALRNILKKGRGQIQVVNMSFECTQPDEEMQGLCETLHHMGIVLVAASGNIRDGEQSVYMTKYPAAYDGVIGVGCVDSTGLVSSFSNCNSGVDLVAGGKDVPLVAFPSGRTYYKTDSGTSFSAPLVSAAAALIVARTPAITPDEVEFALESTAEDLGDEGRDDVYGYGLLNTAAALESIPEGRHTVREKLNAGMAYLMENYADLPDSLRPSEHYVFDYILGLYGENNE